MLNDLKRQTLQGWKKGAHPMGKVRAYDTQPVDPPDEVKLSDFSCKLVTLELVDPTSKKFTEKYSVKVPANIRSRYSDDVVFRGDWHGLLNAFDQKLSG